MAGRWVKVAFFFPCVLCGSRGSCQVPTALESTEGDVGQELAWAGLSSRELALVVLTQGTRCELI